MPHKPLLTTDRFQVVELDLPAVRGGGKRAFVMHPGSVGIVPLVGPDRVCLIRNHRVAVGKTLIEIPAGTIAPQEDPDRAALRELREETGFSAGGLERLACILLCPGVSNERLHLYAARQLTPGEPQREEGEQIENAILPWPEALQLVARGEIVDAKTILGLMFCAQRYWRPL